jgi:hypothetical protein
MTRTHFATNGHATAGIDPLHEVRSISNAGIERALTSVMQPGQVYSTEDMNAMLALQRSGMTGTIAPRESAAEAPMVLMVEDFETPQGRAADTEGLSRVMARIYAPLAWGSVGAFCAVLVMAILDANCVGC